MTVGDELRDEHLDEGTALAFLEAQLNPERAARSAAHVARCATCDALVGALEAESNVLQQALSEADEPLPGRLRDANVLATVAASGRLPRQAARAASGSWTWAWLFSFGVAAAAAYTASAELLQGSSEQLDQTIQFGTTAVRVSVGAATLAESLWNVLGDALGNGGSAMWTGVQDLLVFAALGTAGAFFIRRYWRRVATPMVLAGLAAAALLGAPGWAGAADIRRSQEVTVSASETVQNDLIAMGARVRMDGTVRGDLIAFTQNLDVNGHVTGDVIAFGDQVRLTGTVDGNVRCFCNILTLSGSTGKNVSAVAARIELDPRAAIGGGIISAVGRATLDGKVNRDWLSVVGQAVINGPIGGDAKLLGRTVSVGPEAAIAGQLDVTSNNQPQISSGAKLGHPLEWKVPPQRSRARGFLLRVFIFRHIVGYGTALLCGLLLMKLFPGLFAAGTAAARHLGLAMGVGALVLVSSSALVIFAIMLLIAGAWAGIAAMSLYLPAVYASQIFVGAWIGERMTGKSSAIAQLALGLLVLRVLGIIPFIGFFVWVAALLLGVGALAMAIWNRTRLEPVAVAA